MDEVESVLRVVGPGTREGESVLHANRAAIADLVDMLDTSWTWRSPHENAGDQASRATATTDGPTLPRGTQVRRGSDATHIGDSRYA